MLLNFHVLALRVAYIMLPTMQLELFVAVHFIVLTRCGLDISNSKMLHQLGLHSMIADFIESTQLSEALRS